MTNPIEDIEQLGSALAHARLNSAVVNLPLSGLLDLEEAEAVQAEAADAFEGSPIGYALQATSIATQRRLNCQTPIFGPLFKDETWPDPARIRLPNGVMGAGCSFLFTLGRPYPAEGEEIAIRTVSEAVIACRPVIQILGRRVPGSVPLNEQTATADFALDVASVIGLPALAYKVLDLPDLGVSVMINGNLVASGRGSDILGHPLEAVAWLARALGDRERRLEAGDQVLTGSCTGILQVLPGQTIEADFNGIGTVEATFE